MGAESTQLLGGVQRVLAGSFPTATRDQVLGRERQLDRLRIGARGVDEVPCQSLVEAPPSRRRRARDASFDELLTDE